MSNTARMILSGMSVLINRHFEKDLAVVVEDQMIKAIIQSDMIKHHLPAQQIEYPKDCYLVPGLIDMHVHGAGNCDVMDGTLDALVTISDKLAAEGVTGFLATTMTASAERLMQVLSVIPAAINQAQGAAILGVHLEGPFISPDKAGAQYAQDACAPNIALFNQWQKAADGQIRLVTLAPELENAIEFIANLSEKGVVISAGHTNATYEQTMHAIEAGCTYATHLFNAMRGLHQREPGASGALLLSDAVSAEMVADGKHLHAAMCRLALRVKSSERLLLVTDAMRAKCMGDGTYELGGQTVTVKSGKATLADGTLAGSVLEMPVAIKHMMKATNCSLAEAVHMASYNPAKALKLLARKGSIETGKDADFVIFNEELEVMKTIRAGKEIFTRCL